MVRLSFALLLFALAAWAANIKLYMKDGSYQLVREYSVKSDRVRFYSVERSDWEEVPVELVDIKRTQTEVAQRKATLTEEAKVLSQEDKAERQLQDEIMKIPQNPGVYYLEGGQAKAVKQAESTVHTNKGRSVLKMISPIPMVSGKATVELEGRHSQNILRNPLQEFYIQLSENEHFGIIKLQEKGGVRIAENVTIVPISKEVVEEPTEVEVFRKQLTSDGLYKIWPMQALAPGEYAVMEYTPGRLNMQIWDFAYQPEKK